MVLWRLIPFFLAYRSSTPRKSSINAMLQILKLGRPFTGRVAKYLRNATCFA